MITLKEHTYHDFYLKEKIWEIYKKVRLTKDTIQDVINHFKNLFIARNVFVYSSPASKNINVRNFFKIDKQKKIILVILSSPDERISANMIGTKISSQKVFKDVFEWINFLIKNFSSRNDVALIIRPHPREFPNKREKILSENAIKLSYLFSKIKNNKNVIINLPSDNISIYNIIPYCDTVLTMGSTSTIEATLLGIPCVTMSENFLSVFGP
jgi:lipid A disaccharide synthetase